jgi:hypothetical protein
LKIRNENLKRHQHLEEGGLAAHSHRIDSVLVQASGGGDGRVVVDPVAAVDGPVVAAEVVDGAVAAVLIDEAVFAMFR